LDLLGLGRIVGLGFTRFYFERSDLVGLGRTWPDLPGLFRLKPSAGQNQVTQSLTAKMGSFGFALPAVERASELPKSDFKPIFIIDSADDPTGLAWVRLVKTYQSR
jgi:hypothetical protein